MSSAHPLPSLPDDSPDFITFLQARWRLRPEGALATLGDWLTHYEPARPRPIRVLARRRSPARLRAVAKQQPK
jgi:hypothetical protein